MLRVAKGFTRGGRTPARTLTCWRAMLRTLTRRWVASADTQTKDSGGRTVGVSLGAAHRACGIISGRRLRQYGKRGNKLLEMTPGLAVASFFAGVALLLAMRIVYELVQRKWGYMRGVQRHLANVVLLLAFIVPAIPGITYGAEHAGAQFMGISVFAWNFISIAVSLVLNFVCTVAFRGEEIMREIEQELDDWDDEE